MGKSSGNRKNCCRCGSRRCITNEVCSKCIKRGQGKAPKKSRKSLEKSSEPNHKKRRTDLHGRMDSKHFSSRSTTDNLPSSLSTPGERAGLTSASSAAVDPAAVATSSNNPSTISSHLQSTCGTSGPTDMTSHSPNPTTSEAETDKRLPPDSKDSDSSLSTSSDKTYEPSVCSSNSCSSLSSSLSAVISSSSKAHDECFVTDFQGNGVSSSNDNPCLSQNGKASSNSSVPNSYGQNIGNDTVLEVPKSDAPSSSHKDNNLAYERPDDQNKEGSSFTPLTAKSHPVSGPQISSSITLKDSKPSVGEQSPQSPLSKGVKRTHNELEEQDDFSSSPKPSPQKNKKRCFTCSCKLELAQRTIGKCRCERVFCPIHRLPELHDCEFNHKEDGRREAREKMVKPTRHMGTSFRRDDQT